MYLYAASFHVDDNRAHPTRVVFYPNRGVGQRESIEQKVDDQPEQWYPGVQIFLLFVTLIPT